MANPILSSDLYKDDGAIRKAIAELEALGKAIEDLKKKTAAEAAQIETSFKNVNAASSQQRDTIQTTAKQVDEINRRYNKYSDSLTENAEKIAALKNAQRDINTVNKLTAKLNASAEGSYNRLAAQYGLNKLRLNQMSAEQRKATKAGRDLEKQTKEIYEEMKRLQEATGKHVLSVGDYGKALRDIPGPLGRVINDLDSFREGLKGAGQFLRSTVTGLGGATKALKLFRIALASTGIGLLIVALGSLYAALTRTQEGLDFVNRFLAGVRAAFDVVIDRLATFGGAIIKFIQGDWKGAWEDAKGAVTGFGQEIVSEFEQGRALTGTMQEIRDETRALEVQVAKTRSQIKELNKIAEDTSRSTAELSQAAQDAYNLENDLLQQREALLSKELTTLKAQKDLGNSLSEDLDEIAEKERELANVRTESLEMQTTINNKLNAIRKEGAAAATRAAQEEQRRAEQSAGLIGQVEDANAILAGQGAEVELAYTRAIAKIQELKREAATLGIDLDTSSLEIIETAKLERGIDKAAGLMESTLLPTLATGLSDGAAQVVSDATADFSQRIGEEVAGTREDLTNLPEARGGGLFDFLAFDDQQMQGLKSSFDFAKQQLFDYMDARRQAAAQAVGLADKEVDAAQRRLDAEVEAREAGLANNEATARQELEQAQARREAAQKEEEKRAQQQRRLQTVLQTANLITAVSKIFAELPFFAALPAVGTMFATFAASKIKAGKLAKDEFAEGGLEILGGGLHGSGDDTYLGFQTDRGAAYAERGEAVAIINRKRTAQYRSVLPEIVQSLNSGSFERVFQRAGHDIPFVLNGGSAVNTRRMEDELSAIRRQGEVITYTDGKGRRIEKRKNVTRIYV